MALPVLNQPQFQDEDAAHEYLEKIRWPHGVTCPKCGVENVKVYRLNVKRAKSTRKVLKCGECRRQFTIKTGTIFEDSKIPLTVWLQAAYLMCASKKGFSAHQLHRYLGVTYKTAWFMAHRLREAMADSEFVKLGGAGKVVEADETFWGNNKKPGQPGRGYQHKMKVFSLVERDGNVRSFHVERVNAKTLRPILREQVEQATHVMTDDAGQYTRLSEDFDQHSVVKHSTGEYARGPVYTNTIESFFAVMKRGLHGTYHHIGEQHLKRYCGEFDFRYNNRKVSDLERTVNALSGIEGKRLTYKTVG
ncbi:MAG: IS1595 family transposase [Chrysiogenetes bacterium]|nr:IS1595 family transposase [Chrysiogenetes bacterium]